MCIRPSLAALAAISTATSTRMATCAASMAVLTGAATWILMAQSIATSGWLAPQHLEV